MEQEHIVVLTDNEWIAMRCYLNDAIRFHRHGGRPFTALHGEELLTTLRCKTAVCLQRICS